MLLNAVNVFEQHAVSRDRDGIWNAMQDKAVYGTSGERILLWFDLLNAPGGEAPMGTEASLQEPPRFRVAALGAFKQRPGCPAYTAGGLGEERMPSLCGGECYNPGDERRLITRLEVVRIRPQASPGEPMQLADGSARIEDPWRVIPCMPDPEGCRAEFEDPDFNRDTSYYVRAIQEPAPHINAGTLRAFNDEAGNLAGVRPC